MERIFHKIIKLPDVKNLMREVISNSRYNTVNIPLIIENNYFVNDNYALFLLIDSLLKFDIIIEDEKLIKDYVSQLKRIFKRMNNYQDINKGINSLIGKTTAKKLNIVNYKTPEAKEKILSYIYKKYIVEGYFYYGFSSTYKKELEESGIKKAGFILDSRLDDINTILKKYEKKDIIKRVESDITDNIVVASYFSFLGPDYLEKLANSSIFQHKNYDKSCFYKKDVIIFKENLEKYCKNKHLQAEEKITVINNFLDTWNEERINTSHGCIALIKRSSLKRNFLKNIEEILKGSKKVELSSSIAMIMESRYNSYNLETDIPINDLEIIDIPSYKCMVEEIEEEIIIDYDDKELDNLKITIENTNERKKTNAYGYATLSMLLGLLLISLGITMTIIAQKIGRWSKWLK